MQTSVPIVLSSCCIYPSDTPLYPNSRAGETETVRNRQGITSNIRPCFWQKVCTSGQAVLCRVSLSASISAREGVDHVTWRNPEPLPAPWFSPSVTAPARARAPHSKPKDTKNMRQTRDANHPGLQGTSLVLALKIPHPREPLSPNQPEWVVKIPGGVCISDNQ